MSIFAISTETEYVIALKEVSVLVDADPTPGTLDAERLDMLGALVEAYEAKHYALDSKNDNEGYLAGPQSRVSVGNVRTPRSVPLIGAAQENFYGALTAANGFTLSKAARMYKLR